MHWRNPNEVLADKIRRLRTAEGLSQEGLAKRCRLHRTYIGAIERGERNITLNTLYDIASALGVSPAELISESHRRGHKTSERRSPTHQSS